MRRRGREHPRLSQVNLQAWFTFLLGRPGLSRLAGGLRGNVVELTMAGQSGARAWVPRMGPRAQDSSGPQRGQAWGLWGQGP